MSVKDEFIAIYHEYIKRDGAQKLLEYLESSDFFEAPASSRFHNNFEEGLADHSINVYKRLKNLLDNETSLYHAYSEETIAIVGLLHDLCKINFYVKDTHRVNEGGVWVTRPYYRIDEALPFGHGEKSVYIIQQYLKLTDDEALAIDWHMGPYDDRAKGGSFAIEQAYHKCPLAFLTHVADSLATYIDEEDKENEN